MRASPGADALGQNRHVLRLTAGLDVLRIAAGPIAQQRDQTALFCNGGTDSADLFVHADASRLRRILDPESFASDAEKMAALIKVDEATAARRRAAVCFLGTVDWHYYPEAESELISGLRCDRLECVRLEAALALEQGMLLYQEDALAALLIAANGSTVDGNPSEMSEPVREAARCACSFASRGRALCTSSPSRKRR